MLNDALVNGYSDFVLHAGDISYAEGKAIMWDQFGTMIAPLAMHVPYLVSMGNHEYDRPVQACGNDPSGVTGLPFAPPWGNYGGNDSHGEAGVPLVARFVAPDNGNGIFWYAVERGLVRVVVMSAEHDFLPGSTQYNWLARTLARGNRSATPYTIFVTHR